MTGYNEFQRILAEMKAKIATHENQMPPGFEELFKGFKS